MALDAPPCGLLFAVTIAVTPVHLWMLQTADQWPVPYWALVARLPLQVALLALIVWSTADRPRDSLASTGRGAR